MFFFLHTLSTILDVGCLDMGLHVTGKNNIKLDKNMSTHKVEEYVFFTVCNAWDD